MSFNVKKKGFAMIDMADLRKLLLLSIKHYVAFNLQELFEPRQVNVFKHVYVRTTMT